MSGRITVELTAGEVDALIKTLAHVKRTGMGHVEFDVRLLDSIRRKLAPAKSPWRAQGG